MSESSDEVQKEKVKAIVALKIALPPELIERVDAWRAAQEGKVGREDAVVRLLISHFWPNL